MSTIKRIKLSPGNNIVLTQNENTIKVVANTSGNPSSYNFLNGKPSINGIELTGDLSSQELGISSSRMFETYHEFPAIPIESDLNKFFIDTTNHKMYLWDLSENKFRVIGSDYESINQINGGNANG